MRTKITTVGNLPEAAGRPAGTDAPPLTQSRDQRDDVLAGVQWVLLTFGSTTIVAIEPDTGKIDGRWLDESTSKTVGAWVLKRNQEGWNIYFEPNLPVEGLSKKAKKRDIKMLRVAAFADFDAKGGRTLDQVRDALHLLPMPSIIIATGGGYQPIWLLPEPVPATPEAVAGSEALSRRIAELAGGDTVQNVDRILRMPFTLNFPDETKRAAGRIVCASGLLDLGDPA
jgi:hypothetical protein